MKKKEKTFKIERTEYMKVAKTFVYTIKAKDEDDALKKLDENKFDNCDLKDEDVYEFIDSEIEGIDIVK